MNLHPNNLSQNMRFWCLSQNFEKQAVMAQTSRHIPLSHVVSPKPSQLTHTKLGHRLIDWH